MWLRLDECVVEANVDVEEELASECIESSVERVDVKGKWILEIRLWKVNWVMWL